MQPGQDLCYSHLGSTFLVVLIKQAICIDVEDAEDIFSCPSQVIAFYIKWCKFLIVCSVFLLI